LRRIANCPEAYATRATLLTRLGLSSKPTGGFDKKTHAGDVAGVLGKLKIDRADFVTHDIGNMVGYACAWRIRALSRW
jgi:pimeloyl-ACP methyl ester carboxylesterase